MQFSDVQSDFSKGNDEVNQELVEFQRAVKKYQVLTNGVQSQMKILSDYRDDNSGIIGRISGEHSNTQERIDALGRLLKTVKENQILAVENLELAQQLNLALTQLKDPKEQEVVSRQITELSNSKVIEENFREIYKAFQDSHKQTSETLDKLAVRMDRASTVTRIVRDTSIVTVAGLATGGTSTVLVGMGLARAAVVGGSIAAGTATGGTVGTIAATAETLVEAQVEDLDWNQVKAKLGERSYQHLKSSLIASIGFTTGIQAAGAAAPALGKMAQGLGGRTILGIIGGGSGAVPMSSLGTIDRFLTASKNFEADWNVSGKPLSDKSAAWAEFLKEEKLTRKDIAKSFGLEILAGVLGGGIGGGAGAFREQLDSLLEKAIITSGEMIAVTSSGLGVAALDGPLTFDRIAEEVGGVLIGDLIGNSASSQAVEHLAVESSLIESSLESSSIIDADQELSLNETSPVESSAEATESVIVPKDNLENKGQEKKIPKDSTGAEQATVYKSYPLDDQLSAYGKDPKDIKEELRLVEPSSKEGQEFAQQIESILREALGEHFPFEPGGVKFVLEDSKSPNAFILNGTNPPVIGFSKGLFAKKKFNNTTLDLVKTVELPEHLNELNPEGEPIASNVAELAAVFLHEVGHHSYASRYRAEILKKNPEYEDLSGTDLRIKLAIPNSKLEESYSDTSQLETMRNAGLDPNYMLRVILKLESLNSDSNGVNKSHEQRLKDLADPHPDPEIRAEAIALGVTNLRRKRGNFIGEAPVSLEQDLELKQTLENAYHISWFENLIVESSIRLPRDGASFSETVTGLNQLFNDVEPENWKPVRIEDFGDIIRELVSRHSLSKIENLKDGTDESEPNENLTRALDKFQEDFFNLVVEGSFNPPFPSKPLNFLELAKFQKALSYSQGQEILFYARESGMLPPQVRELGISMSEFAEAIDLKNDLSDSKRSEQVQKAASDILDFVDSDSNSFDLLSIERSLVEQLDLPYLTSQQIYEWQKEYSRGYQYAEIANPELVHWRRLYQEVAKSTDVYRAAVMLGFGGDLELERSFANNNPESLSYILDKNNSKSPIFYSRSLNFDRLHIEEGKLVGVGRHPNHREDIESGTIVGRQGLFRRAMRESLEVGDLDRLEQLANREEARGAEDILFDYLEANLELLGRISNRDKRLLREDIREEDRFLNIDQFKYSQERFNFELSLVENLNKILENPDPNLAKRVKKNIFGISDDGEAIRIFDPFANLTIEFQSSVSNEVSPLLMAALSNRWDLFSEKERDVFFNEYLQASISDRNVSNFGFINNDILDALDSYFADKGSFPPGSVLEGDLLDQAIRKIPENEALIFTLVLVHKLSTIAEPADKFKLLSLLPDLVTNRERHVHRSVIDYFDKLFSSQNQAELISYFENLAPEKAIEQHALLARYRYMDFEFSESFYEMIAKKVSKLPNKEERHSLTTSLLSGSTIQNYQARTLIEETWLKDQAERLGLDDGSDTFFQKLFLALDPLSHGGNSASYSILKEQLLTATEAQIDTTHEFDLLDESRQVENFKEQGALSFLGEEMVIHLRDKPEKRKELLEFLINPLSEKRIDGFVEELGDQLEPPSSNDNIIETRVISLNDREKRVMARQAHETFRDAPPEVRSVAIHQLLLDKDKVLSENDNDIFNYVSERIVAKDDPDREKALGALRNYSGGLEANEKSIVLSGLLVAAAEQSETQKVGIGSALARLAEESGPAEIKTAQTASSTEGVRTDIADDLSRLNTDADPPSRQELNRWIKQVKGGIAESYARENGLTEVPDFRIGKVLGSASIFVAVELEMSDGKSVVVALRRPHIKALSDKGFDDLANGINAEDSVLSGSEQDLAFDLISHARDRVSLEADVFKAPEQAELFQSMYQGVRVVGSDVDLNFETVKVLAAGEGDAVNGDKVGWYMMNKIEGDNLNDILLKDSKVTQKRKRELTLSVLTLELNNILRGVFDIDRHSGQIKVGNSVSHLDVKAISLDTWSSADYQQLGDIIYSITRNPKAGVDFLTAFLERRMQIQEKGQKISSLVDEVQRALPHLGKYTQYLSGEDITLAFASALQNDIHPELKEAILSNYNVATRPFVRRWFETGEAHPMIRNLFPNIPLGDDLIRIERPSQNLPELNGLQLPSLR